MLDLKSLIFIPRLDVVEGYWWQYLSRLQLEVGICIVLF